jgi:hypothetical protein
MLHKHLNVIEKPLFVYKTRINCQNFQRCRKNVVDVTQVCGRSFFKLQDLNLQFLEITSAHWRRVTICRSNSNCLSVLSRGLAAVRDYDLPWLVVVVMNDAGQS